MSEMLKRVADFGAENSACGTSDPAPSACGSACGAADPTRSKPLNFTETGVSTCSVCL